MRPSSRLTIALAVAALALAGASGGGGARASNNASDFPFEFSFEGFVDEADGKGFVVDRLRVALPTASTLLPWDPARYDLEIDEDAIEAGSFVRVHGSLRLDGTVLAQSVASAEASFENGETITFVSGVIEAIDASGLTVDGHAYAFLEEPDRAPQFLLTAGSHQLPLDSVRVGDAVAFLLDVDEDSGDTAVGEAILRPAGDGAVLGGRVTANTLEDGGSFFAHEGLYFEVEGVRSFFPYNEDMAVRAVARDHPDDSALLETLAEGDGVRVTGWYRDGVLFVEDLYADGPGLQIRAARRLLVEGVVAASDGDGVEVNGVAFRLSSNRAALRASRMARVGDRVRVRSALPSEGGEPVARELRRLRRR